MTTTNQSLVVQTFNYDQLDEDVQAFYDDIEQQVVEANNQYRAAIGSIIQQVIDVRGRDEALAWFVSKFQKSERTMQRYLQAARGDDPYPQLRQENNERYSRDNVINDANSSIDTQQDVSPEKESTDIDVAATVAENTQLKKANETLQSQLQDALQQQSGTTSTTRHHSGGGNHHGPPTSEKDGIKRVMRDYTSWQTEQVSVPTGYMCDELKTGVAEHFTEQNKLICYFQNDTHHRTVHIETHTSSKGALAHRLRELAEKLEQYTP
jgi:hypothetical protein